MAPIRLLSEQLINRIAAGEVVERPASVLKELVENSLDAGARRIEIEAAAGGRRRILVADDGQGIPPDDVLLAVERHATSKLAEETDLLRIETLGFRGEALPSIGAVSRLTLTSAARTDGWARRVRLSGGRLLGVEDAARDRGTTVEVRDLFFNVPARRKFLRSTQTEAAHLIEVAQRYALARPECRFVLRHNSQEVLATSPREAEGARLARVLGRETARAMFPFAGQAEGVKLSGYLGRPEISRSRASGLYLYINGRLVSDRLLTRAVLEAYRERLAAGRYPVALIFLSLDPQAVDVNVHPAKAQVRFRQPGQVISAATEIIARALRENLRPMPARPAAYHPAQPQGPPPAVAEAVAWKEAPAGKPAPPVTADQEVSPPDHLRPIGQLFQAYILAQGPEGLYVVDQHAAHERVLYERLQGELAAGRLASQALLLPLTFDLSPTQAAGLESLRAELERCGFDLAPFGGQTYVLKAVPAVLAGRDVQAAVGEIIDQADDLRPEAGLQGFQEALLKTLACHGAVKAGDELTRAEMDRLLADLDQSAVPTHCPHGRPLVFHLDRQEIEKRFKRS